MNRYLSIIFSAIFLLIAFVPYLAWGASITETKAAIGEKCRAIGDNSTAMGYYTTASGDYSTAMSRNTTASGDYSTAIGCHTEASGWYSTAMGYYTTASGDYSTAMGALTTASGHQSVTMGYETRAGGSQSWAGGKHMQLTDTADYTFVWGISTSPQSISTDNAFLIFPAGTAGKVGIGTKSPKCLLDSRNENASFDSSDIGDLQLLVGNDEASTSGGKAAIGFAVSNLIGSDNIFGAMITHTPEDSYSNGGLEFWTKDTNTSIMTLTEKMRIDRNGNVGIGTVNPSYKLHVMGSVAGTSWSNISSRDFKKDIRKVNETAHPMMLAKIMDMELTTYKYKETYGGDGTTKLGFIAEDMPKEVLSKDGKGVDVYELLTLTIGAMKAQQKENEVLKAKLTEVMQRLEILELEKQ